jgi:Asp-tRNA(Asn)/Glu-tRNA(Gln) amidotransferase A subunit family amidase
MSNFLGDLPRLFPRPEQTIAGIGRLLRLGEVTCVDILNACLEQVDKWEPKVHAWVVLDRAGAMEQARALDEELPAGKDRGPLHGIPIGVKDIIDVRGLPTGCGAKRWADSIASSDFEFVSHLRANGAVIMGKTVTTPYAWIDPPVTRNPWNLERTPGGSSSGSAAAVSCGMCYGALGTQTGGSITRPASFCGIAGMKPSRLLDLHSAGGVLPFAPSLDHVGPLARTTDDLRLILSAMAPERLRRLARFAGDDSPRTSPPRLVRFRGFFDRRAEPTLRSAVEESLSALASDGAEIVDIEDPGDFEQVVKDHRRVMAAEAASVHSEWLDEFPGDYPPRITELIGEGRSLTALEYVRAKAQQDPVKNRISDLLELGQFDAVITPATVGTAPDRSTTGDPAFNSPWSFSGLPTVSFPVRLAGDGMPLAIQLVGYGIHDYDLLRTAEWCENAIRTWRH